MSQDEQPDQGRRERPAAVDDLWPAADYHRQVEDLRSAVGERIYVAELRDTETQLGVHLSDRAYELLGVIDFPRPDPQRGLAPHLVLLDDGRGLNLGRIARISRRPFQPAADDVLYLDREADQTLLFADRRLSKRFIAERAQAALGQVLGQAPPAAPVKLAQPQPRGTTVSEGGDDASADGDDPARANRRARRG
jgi:hypothetical protein